MNSILKKPELTHDDINPSYNIENEINNYRNLLKQHNVEDINNKEYQYQDGVYYMDIVSEAEKLGRLCPECCTGCYREENISMHTFILIGYLST